MRTDRAKYPLLLMKFLLNSIKRISLACSAMQAKAHTYRHTHSYRRLFKWHANAQVKCVQFQFELSWLPTQHVIKMKPFAEVATTHRKKSNFSINLSWVRVRVSATLAAVSKVFKLLSSGRRRGDRRANTSFWHRVAI